MTAEEIIADEIICRGDLWDLDDGGLNAAVSIIRRLKEDGFEIVAIPKSRTSSITGK